MSSSAEALTASAYDGCSARALATRLCLPRVELFDVVGSTLDVAHAIADDAPSGTLVLADRQSAGRGRQGRRWESPPGAGVWLTLVERPADMQALDVLSLRCGLHAAAALDGLAEQRIALKWPNDLYLGGRKLAGILIETRWRGSAPDWVAIGFGLNVVAPELETATGLRAGTSRLDALTRLVPALRAAVAAHGHLAHEELEAWRSRDLAFGRTTTAPAAGVARGVSAAGELLIEAPDGIVSRHRTGSLTFDEPLPCS
ncbi:MAG TPA: biotin--[acetyl-CoA-carboxylase] ligase [Gemmatimonadaceae bacterium]|jgi:BirA family biotin operon repressor/biotin-[acetyl-CoA-carboxylase] ligase